MATRIETPLSAEKAKTLRSGDEVSFSGVIYTARDAAHKRLVALVQNNEALPFPLEGAVLYYVGPTPAKPGAIIGSCGPTTSYRMDAYAPTLLDRGLRGMIGKGKRGSEVVEAIRRNGAVYFGAIGGAGALLASRVKRMECVAYEDLGPEAIYRLEVEDFPAVVLLDAEGRDLYKIGRREYLSQRGAQ